MYFSHSRSLPQDLADAALLGVGAALKYLAPLASSPQKVDPPPLPPRGPITCCDLRYLITCCHPYAAS